MAASQLVCQDLEVAVPGRTLVRGLSLDLPRGSCVGLLGRNGAGKTTTLHALAGLHECRTGEIRINGRPLAEWPRRQLARSLGLLMQNDEHSFPSSVLSAALIGRHPHMGFLQWEDSNDVMLARRALAQAGLNGLEARDVSTLSGGELRRLAIATLLAQDPQIMLLDEPVNHLDISHQLMLLRLLREKARAGYCIVLSLHDVNLAVRFCDRALLLFGDGTWTSGAIDEVVDGDTLSRLYETDIRSVSHAEGSFYFAA